MGETLEQAMARGRAPGLDHIRLIAATAVVVSHAWPLALGQGAPEPMTGLLGIKLGESAVLVFFFLSGLLIAESAYRTRDNKWKFLANRGLRIAPGLFVALIVTVLIAVFCGANPSWGEAAIYVLRGITLVSLEHTLSGAFANAPYPEAVNGPLWTLFYEVFCYAVIATAVWTGVRTQRIRWIVAGALILLLLLATDLVELPPGAVERRLSIFSLLGFVFLAGSLAWLCKPYLPLRADYAIAGLVLTGAVSIADPSLKIGHLLLGPALGYAALVYGYTNGLRKLPGDISYGVYIYGWPVAQATVSIWGPMSPNELAILSTLAVIPVAVASWLMVEKPALDWGRSRRRPT